MNITANSVTRPKSLLLVSISTVCLIILLLIGHEVYLYSINNFHSVINNQLYRSGQLNANQLNSVINKYHIKSVINLRGIHLGTTWYDNEINTTTKMHVKHYDIRFDAHTLPTRGKLQSLLNIIEKAPKPVLIHCHRGADRTGLAVAIYLLSQGDKSLDQMEDQVSWWYGALSPTSVGYQVMRNYQIWLKQRKLSDNKSSFMAWMKLNTPLKPHWGLYIT